MKFLRFNRKPATPATKSATCRVENLESRMHFDATFAAAANIGPLNGVRTFNDSVSQTLDHDDYRKFTLQAPAKFSAVLSGLSSDADLYLYNSSQSLIASSTAVSNLTDSVSRNLSAGTYFVRVAAFNGTTPYNLKLTSDAAGETLGTARNAGFAVAPKTFSDAVSGTDSVDFYRFTVQQPGTVRLQLTGLAADADLQLIRDANNNGVVDAGEVLSSSSFGGTTNDTIAFNATTVGSNYFARVNSFDSRETNYRLSISGPLDQAGNTPARARNLGFVSGHVSFREFVGSTDLDDFYKFTVDAGSNITARISGLTADADLKLIGPGNVTLSTSANGGTFADQVSANGVAAGTYFVRVYRFSGDTFYNLDLDVT
jgi:hypothetical protein